MRDIFIANATVVLSALSDPRVADSWNDPSILDDQTVGALAGHLARGSVWVVGQYLEVEPPDGAVDFETAAEYFAEVASRLTSADHAAIRARGASVAADGHEAIVTQLRSRSPSCRHASRPSRRIDSLPCSRAR